MIVFFLNSAAFWIFFIRLNSSSVWCLHDNCVAYDCNHSALQQCDYDYLEKMPLQSYCNRHKIRSSSLWQVFVYKVHNWHCSCLQTPHCTSRTIFLSYRSAGFIDAIRLFLPIFFILSLSQTHTSHAIVYYQLDNINYICKQKGKVFVI